MQAQILSTRTALLPLKLLLRVAAVGGLILAAVRLQGGTRLAATMNTVPSLHLHLPRLSMIAAAPLAIRIHIAAALTALVIGLVLMAGVKGSRAHRVLGYGWVAAMGVTAVGSFFIRVIDPGHWSFIHFASGWVTVALPIGLVAALRHNVRLHRRMMTGLFIGGLVVAGAFTFAPGRLMFQVFLG